MATSDTSATVLFDLHSKVQISKKCKKDKYVTIVCTAL